MPGKAPRQKGDRAERAIVKLLQVAGLDAKRVPLSGSVAGYPGDVCVKLGNREWCLEIKSRKDFATLYKWLDDRDALVLKANRREPLLIVRLADILTFLEEDQRD